MIVVCCGMRRSGSSLQYHIAKELISQVGGHAEGWLSSWQRFDEIAETFPATQFIACKVHLYLPKYSVVARRLFSTGHARGLYIFRDPRDVAASLKRFRPKLDLAVEMNAVADTHRLWIKHPGLYVSRYDDVVDSIEGETIRIARVLNIAISVEQAYSIADKLSMDNMRKQLPTSGYSEDRILWDNHIFTGKNGLWRHELTENEISTVTRLTADIIAEYGSMAK